MDPRLLLPDLPPELRNLIYTHTISSDHPATTAGLPFTHKTYDSGHTTVTLTPTHHGCPSLLALHKFRFQEAREYYSYLLTHAVQLRISILFNGNVNTFVQEHWDKKIACHLKKLEKRHKWLAKVVDYDVRILWEPCAKGLGKRRRSVGAVAKRMVDVVTGMMDEGLREKGVVRARLCVGGNVAVEHVLEGQRLGLADFVSLEDDVLRKQVREVRIVDQDLKADQLFKSHDPILPSHLTTAPKFHRQRGILFEENSVVEWAPQTDGCLLFCRGLEQGQENVVIQYGTNAALVGEAAELSMVHMALARECVRLI